MAETTILATINPTSLANKELAKNLIAINKEAGNINNSRWTIAGYYSNIVTDGLWQDDFDSQKQFAEMMGVSNGTITEMVHAYNYAVENDVNMDVWTIGKVYTLSKIEDMQNFEEWLLGLEEPLTLEILSTLSDKAVKNLLKAYLDSKKPVELEEVPTEEAGEEVEEAQEEHIEMVTFAIGDKVYSIPADILAGYEITQYDNN